MKPNCQKKGSESKDGEHNKENLPGSKKIYSLCFLNLCQRSIRPISMVLTLSPQPKALKLNWYTKLFCNLFLKITDYATNFNIKPLKYRF